MAPVGLRYTLVGFAAELDWRPLRFVEPIPQNRICRACGVVSRRAALLPCTHLLCDSCYKQCVEQCDRLCPLDGYRCQDRDVDWKETPAHEILKRQVTCWNEGNGCAKVMDASEVSRHFQRQCEHHMVSCPKCSATVLRSSMCAHLKSDCRASLVTPLATEGEGKARCKDETRIFSWFRQALEEQACEMKAFLERLLTDRGSRDDRCNEICLSINESKEPLRQERANKVTTRDKVADGRMSEETGALNELLTSLTELIRKSQDSSSTSVGVIMASNEHLKECLPSIKHQTGNLARSTNSSNDALKTELTNPRQQESEGLEHIAYAIKTSAAEAEGRSENTLLWIKQLFRMAGLQIDYSVFFVKGVQALKQTALENGFAICAGEVVYLRGYCITPGVRIAGVGDSATLHVMFQLHRGAMDDAVPWPFGYKIRLGVVHPVSDAKCEIVVTPARSRKLERPAESSNEVSWYPSTALKLQDLIRDGYVLYDRIRVKFQLML